MSTYSITYGSPNEITIDIFRDYLVDFHGDYVACTVVNSSGTDTMHLLVMGGEIQETSSGFTFSGSDVYTFQSSYGGPGGHNYGSYVVDSYHGSGDITNAFSLLCWSSVGAHPRLQSAQLVREGVPLYAFSVLLLLCVGAVCCGVSGIFRHLH